MPLFFLGLEAEFKGHAAEDQPEQHQGERDGQRIEDHRVGQREGAKQRRTAQYQPGFVAVPHRGDGVHHHITVTAVLNPGEQDADTQIKAVHYHVHHGAEHDDHKPNQRKINAHAQLLSSRVSFTADSGRAGRPSVSSSCTSCCCGPLRISRIM
ncbi:hypothetical protein D3C78_785130 [compost metagenome]